MILLCLCGLLEMFPLRSLAFQQMPHALFIHAPLLLAVHTHRFLLGAFDDLHVIESLRVVFAREQRLLLAAKRGDRSGGDGGLQLKAFQASSEMVELLLVARAHRRLSRRLAIDPNLRARLELVLELLAGTAERLEPAHEVGQEIVVRSVALARCGERRPHTNFHGGTHSGPFGFFRLLRLARRIVPAVLCRAHSALPRRVKRGVRACSTLRGHRQVSAL
mmetsp:Transcript_3278/g.8133  ORF Transcript_3278/g.8133 Transcript_3278/m.8133 type:complete len:220 (+) Transcript_3278:726-1385(+)